MSCALRTELWGPTMLHKHLPADVTLSLYDVLHCVVMIVCAHEDVLADNGYQEIQSEGKTSENCIR